MIALGVVQQVKRAFKRTNRLATSVGFLLGGFVPVALFVLTHPAGGVVFEPGVNRVSSLVAGGLLYSAQTVFQWARLAFGQALKAAGFVVLLEGVMVVADARWLALVALGYLVVVNGVATGCTLSLGVVKGRVR
jgi:hypothetical protein